MKEWLLGVWMSLVEWWCPKRLPEAIMFGLRMRGARIGEGCWIWSDWVPSEPYLLEIGNRVRVSRLVRFMTHDGSAGQGAAVFGRISVGDDTFIGLGSLILPGTTIGKNCIIGAGSVVRGMVPDGSVVMGNPAKVVMTTAMARKLSARNRDIIQVRGLSAKEREQVVRKHFGLDSGG